ncbi:MAG: ribosome biogenesis GTPase YlqF [Acidiferrobacterales bacterium]|nr:ribosome biogenesis GTPase YlqF [Acidiferrobacterales bacterium]
MGQIQWYPGHMHKAQREIREMLSQVDMFIELLDARLPYSSANPLLAEIRGDKPCIRVMTKKDLADPARTLQWLEWYQGNDTREMIAVASQDRQQIRSLTQKCRTLFPTRENAITVMIVGIPNVGKSTVINVLANRAVAKTGNEPAVTKMQQKIKLDHNVVLLDTPGVLWPNVENPQSGFRLAASGAIRQTAISFEDVAWSFAEFALQHYPGLLRQRYGFSEEGADAGALLSCIGKLRGCLKSGGLIDQERVARILLGDFRDGTLGPMTLETPEMMREEVLEVERLREEKARRKAERKNNWKKGKKER